MEPSSGNVQNVGIPKDLAKVIDQLKEQFPQLGITGRNAFVSAAVQDKIEATLKRLVDMRDLGMLQAGDVEKLKAWQRGKKS